MKKIMAMMAVVTLIVVGGLLQQAGAGQGEKSNQEFSKGSKCFTRTMHFYMDTHDTETGTFPAGLTPEQFEPFYASYEKALYEEGVIPVRVHVGYEDGRAFCLTMAPSVEAVKRAHDRAGLPYDSITEVMMATPGDTFFRPPQP